MFTDELQFLRQLRKVDKSSIDEINTQLAKVKIECHEKHARYSDIINKQYAMRHHHGKKEPQHFVKACPLDTCRGFLSTAYKCGMCDSYFCSDCNEQKISRVDETHVCNVEMKATLDLIKSDSKPCPKCSILIYKVSGCPQMWCVQCHTAFDWNTGLIDNGYVHNPEYFRYLRENGQDIPRNPNDIVNGCQLRLPTLNEMRRGLSGMDAKIWAGWYDFTQHVRWYLLPNDARQFRDTDYSGLRVDYLNEQITLEEWKKNLKMKIKKNELMLERFMVLDMYCNVMSDLFVNLSVDKNADGFLEGSRKILGYTNTQMEKVNGKYGSKDKRYFLCQDDRRIKDYFN